MNNLSKIHELKVFYEGQEVGTLIENKEGIIAFRYSSTWLNHGFSISPFSLPLSPKLFIAKSKDFEGLFGVFAASLPGAWGSLLRDRYLAKQGINPLNLSPLEKLALLDSNARGALTYCPNYPLADSSSSEQELSLLQKGANEFLNDKKTTYLKSLYNVAGSSGGARPKANIIYQGEKWLVKFPCYYDRPDIALEEMAYNDCATSLGLEVATHRLFKTDKGPVFGSKRFDREGSKKIHLLSFGELLEVSHERPILDYGHLFRAYQNLGARLPDLMDVFSLLCFNVFAHNYDDHSGNVSFIYDEKKKHYVLAPFYDLVGPQIEKEHEMTVNGKGHPEDEDIMSLAELFGLHKEECLKRKEEIKNRVNKMLGRYLKI